MVADSRRTTRQEDGFQHDVRKRVDGRVTYCYAAPESGRKGDESDSSSPSRSYDREYPPRIREFKNRTGWKIAATGPSEHMERDLEKIGGRSQQSSLDSSVFASDSELLDI
jgi:hypothetical protein